MAVYLLAALLLTIRPSAPADSTYGLAADLLQVLAPDTTGSFAEELYDAWRSDRPLETTGQAVSTRFFVGQVSVLARPKEVSIDLPDGIPVTIDLTAVPRSGQVVLERQRQPVVVAPSMTCADYRVVARVADQTIPLYVTRGRLTPGQTNQTASIDVCHVGPGGLPADASAAYPERGVPTVMDAIAAMSRKSATGGNRADALYTGVELKGRHRDLLRVLKQAGYDPATRYLFVLVQDGQAIRAPGFAELRYARIQPAYTASPTSIQLVLTRLEQAIRLHPALRGEVLADRTASGSDVSGELHITELPLFDFSITYRASPRMVPFDAHVEMDVGRPGARSSIESDAVQRRILSDVRRHLQFTTGSGRTVAVRWTERDQVLVPAYFAQVDRLIPGVRDTRIRDVRLDFQDHAIRVAYEMRSVPVVVDVRASGRNRLPGIASKSLLLDGQVISRTEGDTVHLYARSGFDYAIRVEHPFFEPVEHRVTESDIERGRVDVALDRPLQVDHVIVIDPLDLRNPGDLPRAVLFAGEPVTLSRGTGGTYIATARAPVSVQGSPLALLERDQRDWTLVTSIPEVDERDGTARAQVRHRARLVRRTALRSIEVTIEAAAPVTHELVLTPEIEAPPGCTAVAARDDLTLTSESRSDRMTFQVSCPSGAEDGRQAGTIRILKPRGFDVFPAGARDETRWTESTLAVPFEASETVRLVLGPLPALDVFFVEIAHEVLDRNAVYNALQKHLAGGSNAFLYVSNGTDRTYGDADAADRILASMFKMDAWGTNVYEELSRLGGLLSQQQGRYSRLRPNVHLLLSTESYYTLAEEPGGKLMKAVEALGVTPTEIFLYVNAAARQKHDRVHGCRVTYCRASEPIRLMP